MKRRIVKLFKFGTIFCLVSALSLMVVYKVMAAPTDDDYLLRVEVQDKHGESVTVSAPLALLHTVFALLPKDIKRLCEETKLNPDQIIKEITNMEGKDLVRVVGDENVRVWFEPITSQNRAELGFIKVHVKEGGEHGETIDVCVPRGLVQLAGQIVKSLGLVDKFVKLPPEFSQLKVVTSEN